MKHTTVFMLSITALAVVMSVGCGVSASMNDPAPSPSGDPTPIAGAPAGSTGGVSTGSGGAAVVGSGTGGTGTAVASGGAPAVATDAGAVGAGGATTPPDPASTAGIDINGTFVPRDHAIVFIHFGHSNMAGRALVPASLMPYFYTTRPNLWSYTGGKFVAAKEPTAGDGTFGQGAGPGMAWLIAAAAKADPSYHFISIAKAQTSAPTTDFVKGGLYYSSIVDPAKQLKGKVTFGAIFTMLGITDRHLPTAQQGGMADRMVSIANDIRADLGEPNLPMLNSAYEQEATGALAITGAVGMKFAPQILTLPTRIPNSVLIPTDKLDMMDDHHFTMQGHKDWADRGVQLMVDKGWFPWTK